MIGNRRRPKKWYSKTFAAETMKVMEILAKDYAYKGVATIIENIRTITLHKGYAHQGSSFSSAGVSSLLS
jgi:hypothetical protein